jgi:hypothetical protein
MADEDEVPTLRSALENWLGVQLPTVSLPQTIKNIDKAIAKIVLAGGENLEARIRTNTLRTKAQGKINVDGLFRTEEEKRKLQNRAAATSAAIEDLGANAGHSDASSEIDDDWLNLFARLAEDKSSEELQRLFGKLLAGEIRRPGSFSLRTMSLVATISRGEAQAVSSFLSYAINERVVPFGTSDSLQPTPVKRLLMEELGIAGHPTRIGGMAWTVTVAPNSDVLCLGTENGILVRNRTDREFGFSIPGQLISETGRELIPIAYLTPTDVEFLKEIATGIHTSIRGSNQADVEAGLIPVHVVRTTRVTPDLVNYNILFTVPK